jgi:hypothetical protein
VGDAVGEGTGRGSIDGTGELGTGSTVMVRPMTSAKDRAIRADVETPSPTALNGVTRNVYRRVVSSPLMVMDVEFTWSTSVG